MAADQLHSARRVAQRDVGIGQATQRSRWADMQPPFGPGAFGPWRRWLALVVGWHHGLQSA